MSGGALTILMAVNECPTILNDFKGTNNMKKNFSDRLTHEVPS